MTSGSTYGQIAGKLALLVLSTLISLVVLDLALIATGLFAPRTNPGHPEIGWRSGEPSDSMRDLECVDQETGRIWQVRRNEDGVRTSFSASVLRGTSTRYEIIVAGDSHTDLCASNDSTHFGVMEAELNAMGLPTAVMAFGAGRYSPLQAYLAVKPFIRDYRPQALVLNVYTGNDFYDLLRVDDRPHFVLSDTGYVVAPPVWYTYDAPESRPRSRVLHAFRLLTEKVGVRRIALRARLLREAAAEQGQGVGAVVRYLNDVRRSAATGVGYPRAFAAQMLNQQLFFRHFPGSREESLRRVAALLSIIRAENPDLLLVMSPIPSYQLVRESEPDSVFADVLWRLPLTWEGGVREEMQLHESLRTLSIDAGWVFVSNVKSLRASPLRDWKSVV